MQTFTANKNGYSKDYEMKRLFIAYQSLHIQYKERADSYRKAVKRDVIVYSDCVARLAKSKADYYERMLNYSS